METATFGKKFQTWCKYIFQTHRYGVISQPFFTANKHLTTFSKLAKHTCTLSKMSKISFFFLKTCYVNAANDTIVWSWLSNAPLL